LLRELRYLEILDCPILIGISRKSMIYRALNCSPEESLNGSTALHMAALVQGAHILRVHDVKPATETIRLFSKLCLQES
jgi:dihydropteroate synthase